MSVLRNGLLGCVLMAFCSGSAATHFKDDPTRIIAASQGDSTQIGLGDKHMDNDAISVSPTSPTFGNYHISMHFQAQDEIQNQMGEPHPDEMQDPAVEPHLEMHGQTEEPNPDENQDQVGELQDTIFRSTQDVQEARHPWRTYFESSECQRILAQDAKSGDFVKCQLGKPMMYSPSYRFAYMKTPKAASTAFFKYFQDTFQDAYQVEEGNVPEDTFVFTFVRRPVEQKLSAFAEVDLKQLGFERFGNHQGTTFQNVPAAVNQGRDRLAAFLDDLENHRFQRDDIREPSHASSQLAGVICTHKVDFIGRLEYAQKDWQHVQDLAGLPASLRTSAVPLVHDGYGARYKSDEHTPLNQTVKQTLCRLYPADFICLGYDKPEECN